MNKNVVRARRFPAWAIACGVLGVIVLVTVFWGVSTHNGLVRLNEGVSERAATVETNLQRRMDLIPNLVKTVSAYAGHEAQLFAEVTEARSRLGGAIADGDMNAISEQNGVMESALGRLIAVTEAYPDLKANTVFIGLMDELAGSENRISKAREDYNGAVADYNKERKVFPASIIAGMGGFEERAYFEADEGAEVVPEVEL